MLMTGMMAGALAGCEKTEKSPVTTDRISPIVDADGADPFVMNYGDGYLYTKTTGGNVSLALAPSIETLGVAEWKVIYEPGSELVDLWAPEIWRLDDAWYVYFAATVPGQQIHRMYVLSNPNENPMEGTWDCAEVAGMDDKFAIDGTVMELDDKRYFLWSGWEGDENVRQDIYLAEMISPTSVADEKILLTRPELSWEKKGNPLVNEGPEVTVRGQTVNLVYSASGSWTDDYCLGLLTLEKGADPKNPANWTKHPQPIMAKTGVVYGPGHHSVVKSKDGAEDLIIYHAARWKGAGWTRGVRFGHASFAEDGTLAEMTPVSGAEDLPVPSGENQITTYYADAFHLSGDLEKKGADIAGFEYVDDYMTVNVPSDQQKDEVLVVFARVDERADGPAASMELKLGDQTIARNLYAGKDYQPIFFPVTLEKGKNEVRIHSEIGGTRIYVNRLEVRE